MHAPLLVRGFGLFLVAIQPLAASASVYPELLEKDIAIWEQTVPKRQSLEAAFDEENEWQAVKELFPAANIPAMQAASRSPIEDRRAERTDGLVAILVDGKEVVLRDVKNNQWFGPYVRAAAEARLVSGYRDASGNPTGEYKPAQGVSLEELAKIAVQLSGGVSRECVRAANPTVSEWASPFVGCAEAYGWSVYADAAIDVTLPATRAQVIVTVLQAYEREMGEKTGTAFTDVTLSTEFGAAIERAKIDGIVVGFTDEQGMPTGFFGPLERVSRAEIAKIAIRAMQVYGR